MQYRTNPKNGDKLSILGFGCMRFGGNELKSFTGKINKEKTENLILSAIEKGVNFFDSAYIYQGSEELLGTILAKNSLREKVYISTKMPLIMCRSKSDFDKFFNRQLERLQTNYIDYYMLHMLSDTKTWNMLCEWGVESWIAEKKAAGKIKQIGFSFHGSREEFLALLEVYDWDNVLIQCSYSDENFQAGITGLKKAASKGMAVFIMEPLLGGRLATGLPQAAVSRFKRANPSMSPAAWALRWGWNKPEVTLLLSGMNEMDQLDENVKTAEVSSPDILTQEEINVFQDVKNIVNEAYKVNCTGCNYCMPCPFGVNIPGCFTAYNTHFAISKTTAMLQYSMGTMMSQKPSYASLCKECGKCEPHCPQKIPIAKSLKEVAKKMENTQFKLMRFGIKIFTKKNKTEGRKTMTKRKKVIISVIGLLVAIGLFLVGRLAVGMVRYQQTISGIVIKTPDLTQIQDGRYNGFLDAFAVAADVDVIVKDHRITEIVINNHKYGYDKALEAEPIILDVVNRQSLEVDAVSGATNSSKVILKAVQNALESEGK